MTRTGSATITKGAYHLFIGNIISTIILAVTAIIVGRLLGPDRYGLYTIALIVPAYAFLLLRMGVSSTITRYSAKYLSEGTEKKAVSFSYTISILHLVVTIGAIAALIPFSKVISTSLLHRPELSNGIIIPIALLSVIGQIMFNNGSAAFVGLHAFRKSAIFQIIMAIAKLGTSVSLVLLGYSVLGAVVGYTFGFMVAGVISILILVSINRSLIPADVKQYLRIGGEYATPIYLSILVAGVITPIQNTILAYYVSNTQIGWYSAALNIASFLTIFTYPVSTALLPLFSKTVRGGLDQLADTYRLSMKYSAYLVTPVTMLTIALSTPLVTVIYGPVYQPSGHYLAIIAVISLLVGLGNVSWNAFLYGVGETRKAFIAMGTGSIICILISVALVFFVGVYAAIVGTVIGNVTSLLVGSRFVSRILQTKLNTRQVYRIYLSSALSAAAVYPLSFSSLNSFLIVSIGTGIFVMIVIPIMALTQALTREDLDDLALQFGEVKIVQTVLRFVSRYAEIFSRKRVQV